MNPFKNESLTDFSKHNNKKKFEEAGATVEIK